MYMSMCMHEVPKWTLRLMSQLSARQGAAAQLSAGHWGGLGSMIHGTGSIQKVNIIQK